MRPRIAVATTFPIHPRLGGGQVRVHNLYRQLARWFEVEIVSLTSRDETARTIALAPGLRETVVPKSTAHDNAERLLEAECGRVVTDIAMADLYELTPDYLAALRKAAGPAQAVVACHPFTLDAIRAVSAAPLWYEAQDVEYIMKRDLLEGARGADALLATVERVERGCCEEATWIWACSDQDRDKLVCRYGADRARMLVVPNGADLEESPYVDGERRRRFRAELGLGERPLAVFVASWHPPNVDGARAILAVAERLRTVDFMVLGSVGLAFSRESVPENVRLTGPVSRAFKQDVLAIANAALNPVISGSGTNLKMLDYFATGVPVISTAFGARGLSVDAGHHYLEADHGSFSVALRRLAGMAPVSVDRMTAAARRHVETTMSWEVIARDLADVLQPPDRSAAPA